jgi:hypothetical protein
MAYLLTHCYVYAIIDKVNNSSFSKGYAVRNKYSPSYGSRTGWFGRFEKFMREASVWLIIGLIACGVFLVYSGRGLLVSESTAVKALETQGFSNIKIESHDWFAISWRGGSKDDVARFTAHATNPAGKRVEVHVYAGWPFKGATVRSP